MGLCDVKDLSIYWSYVRWLNVFVYYIIFIEYKLFNFRRKIKTSFKDGRNSYCFIHNISL